MSTETTASSSVRPEARALRERLIESMQAEFGGDRRRIEHALSVLEHAEAIQSVEGGDRTVVVAAAILHDIGIREAERKYGSSDAHHQEAEGPPIARGIMGRLGMEGETVEHVCRIIANHHSARGIDTPEFRAVWDADWLVNLKDDYADRDDQWRRATIERVLRTPTGKARATPDCRTA